MRKLIATGIVILFLSSCFQEDEIVPPHEQGNLEVGLAALGPVYGMQVYYDLNSNREVASNIISSWDLSFDCAPDQWNIRLNSSKFMYAGNSHDTAFEKELKAASLDMKFDASHGDPDSTAMNGWYEMKADSAWSRNEVYLVNRGNDEESKAVGYKKLMVQIRGDAYRVRYADPDNEGDTVVVIDKDPERDRLYFSFDKGVVDIAPGLGNWSLLFTKYTTMLVTNEGENYPYLVMGALLNPDRVAATLDTIHDFAELELADTLDLEFTTRADVIGYDWKYFNFNAGVYTIEPDKFYVIRDRDGFYYKLRFIDFYNDEGQKGYPKFEFIRL